MPFRLPSLAYPHPGNAGYWDPVTATINWCEEDYYASHYVAEVVNTFTNAIFIYLASVGVCNCIKNDHPRVFLVAYVGYMFIGLSSFIYHTTLKYWMQLFDELSMIYTTCVLFFAVFSHGKSTLGQLLLGIFTAGLALFITVYYHYLGEPVFHQVMFAVLTATVVFRSIYVMEKTLRPPPPAVGKGNGNGHGNGNGSRSEKFGQLRDQEILCNMWAMITTGLSAIAIGFLFWNLDNIYCSSIRRWRRQIGLPWGVVLEGHGWW
ncbi:Alkaline ceramidase 3 [Colletotrichum trifolii]|uniref:Alkaline ceramidase 3 n=1 Tax=Colletotrichum trifolii TaxID=5466 RepID=A0A4R8R0F3_COLTR|nr:Alkaline ceramidase 3 [Colletotrichum trifolii]